MRESKLKSYTQKYRAKLPGDQWVKAQPDLVYKSWVICMIFRSGISLSMRPANERHCYNVMAVPIALSQDRRLHGHNRLVNWTPCSRMRESKLKSYTQKYRAKLPGDQWVKAQPDLVYKSWVICMIFRSGISLSMRPANERHCYNVTTSLIGWTHT